MVRLLFGWGLIALGLAATVGDLFMFYLYAVMYSDMPPGMDYRETHAMLFGRYLPWSARAIEFCGGGGAWILIGLALIFLGLRVRLSPSGSAWNVKKRGKRRDCKACGATNSPRTLKCYRCGKPF
jgi:hypothetical protein